MQSYYINPNTRGLTSNYKNTVIKDKEAYNEAMSQRLLNPVEDLRQVLKASGKSTNSTAQAAYEQLKANNRTYQFADEKTKKQIAYISDYYLQTVPESVKAAWQETLEETGFNPFQTDVPSTLTQLSVEQDFLTGGNDNILGETKESCLAAIDKILERIEHPLAAVTEERAAYLQQEKEFYTVLASKIGENNNVKPGQGSDHAEYQTENYRIVPDNEAECFDIYNKDGEHLGAFSYSDIKIRQDAATGKQFLISEHGTMSYDALVLDEELKEALQSVMDTDSLDVETLQGFTLNTHPGTGIQYLVKAGEEGRGGKVLLQNETDRKKYEELAEKYFEKYPNLIESREEGLIWADLEIRGMAKRTDQGILSIGADGMSYSDNENYKNNWSVWFSGPTYENLHEWLQNHKDSMEEIHKFSTWQKVFDEIGGSYERVWSKEELYQGYLNN